MLFHQFIGNLSAKKTIVFIHQGLGCSAMWDWYPKQLCESLNVRGLLFDRNGFGKSGEFVPERDNNFLHRDTHELKALIDEVIDTDQELMLYGHSEGGTIALLYAAYYPQTIKWVITEAAHAFVEESTIRGIQDAIRPFEEGKLNGLEKYHGAKYKDVFMAWHDIWLNPDFKSWNILKELENISIPVLLMHGCDDQYGSVQQVKKIAQVLKGKTEEHLITDCGHLPFKEQTQFVQQTVEDFIHGI
jgi:pimeloyl-ACP methyl ester carboxylesterase